ncbi:hypothetical protein [Catenulispora pinisilvae]|uniref:hypothetical protein n=1 Tax=Catenulispora pinisilvae TaxID=2705253 RepID=UPI001891544C|nr:hypothetical protein [Catenulispora pinisilvae]
MGRKILIFAGALALAAEALGTLVVAAAFYGFVAFGNGVKFGPAGPGLLKIVAVALNLALCAALFLGAVILILAAFGMVLNSFMQGLMMAIAALQLFVTIVVTGLTGWTQLFILGGIFVLVAGALAVAMVTPNAPTPEPGPVDGAPTPA